MTGGFDEVYRNMDALEAELHRRAVDAMDEIGHLLANYAKENHLWTPRSGLTDLSTKGGLSEVTREYVRAVLSAGMDYDVFLELAREGKWAWLWPAVVANERQIMQVLTMRLSL